MTALEVIVDKKWRVLIADDEQKVCQLIQYLVPWEELGLELASVASNGQEAIEILKTTDIDILITDARMPECDGIELIKWCSQNSLKIKAIVISGYRNFEYAHGALKYGVNAYLLKPINQKELIGSLKDIIKDLEGELLTDRGQQEMQRIILQNRDVLRNHFINSYMFDGYRYSQQEIGLVDDINREYQMSFKEDTYQAIMIKLDREDEFDVQLDRLLDILKKSADEYMSGFAHEYVSVVAYSGVVMLFNYAGEQSGVFRNKIEELYRIIEKSIDAYDRVSVMIGVGTKENTINNIGRCIAMAGEAVKFRISAPQKKIIYYDDYDYEVVFADQIVTDEKVELLEKSLRNGNREEIGKIVFDCKAKLHSNRNISPVITYAVVEKICDIAVNVMNSIVEEDAIGKKTKKEIEEYIDNARTEEQLWNAVRRLYDQCCDIISQEMANQQTRPVRIIKAYIEEHYGEQITLDSAAEKAGLSPNYASTVFKKETGITFLEYLTSVRLDKATELLRKTDMSINEIAEAVGYLDVKYFSKLCKKTLGMKPSEYRKLYS